MSPRQALAEAISIAGHYRCLAWSLGAPIKEAEKWREVPAEYVDRCAVLTGIPREVLRPDLAEPEQPDLFS